MHGMDYVVCAIMRWLSLLVVAATLVPRVSSGWQKEWRPNYVGDSPEYLATREVFESAHGNTNNFRLLRVEVNRVFIGSRNALYSLEFGTVKVISALQWPPSEGAVSACTGRGKTECDNYIRVMLLKERENNTYYICGTHAYSPQCRDYTLESNGTFKMIHAGESGTGISPFNPNHNSTAIYVDGKVFSATVSDADERDPLILQKFNDTALARTQTRDSIFLNEPNFVSSQDYNDKVFFFFREAAVENINCGKAIFSRVAQVCKNDRAVVQRLNTFTTYFKARLNCSIPGDYPFYFDEIQSTTELGQGNHRPTSDSGNRSDMVYGVFNTPENGLSGSAVCAFRYSSIQDTFNGRFKGQETHLHNWLPVSRADTPTPQPTSCANVSAETIHTTLNFIRNHPLMDGAVPAAGGMPMLVFTSFRSKFTQIAVDWQVLAADGNYYDVMFVGTNDGRVIKAINKGTDKVESVVIEDLQVLAVGEPVVNLKVLGHRTGKESLLVVVSKGKVVSIPLHRCHRATSCSSCVALQDPYCVWNDKLKCINAQMGVQSISTGTHASCGDETSASETSTVPVAVRGVTECVCPPGPLKENSKCPSDKESTDTSDSQIRTDEGDDIQDERLISASTTSQAAGLAIEIVIVAVIVSIIGSLILGFFIGFTFQACRYAREKDVFSDRNYSSLQRGRNRLSSGDNPYFHTDHCNLAPKQMNYLVNPGKMNSLETKPMTKPNKVYV